MKILFREIIYGGVIYEKDNELFIEYENGYHNLNYVLQPIKQDELERYKSSNEQAAVIIKELMMRYGRKNWWDQFEKPDDYDQPPE